VSDEDVSRRAFFTASAAALATAAAAVPAAQAQGRASKAAALWEPNGPQCCAGCVYFRLPHHCQVVRGDISPHGWCRFFRPRVALYYSY
jgi:hypothetical protein